MGTSRVKVRHGPESYSCNVTATADANRVLVRTDDSLAVASGQFAVLYDGDECRGGGVIEAPTVDVS